PASGVTSYHALIEHGISDFYESSYVGADHKIAGLSVLFRSIPGGFEDRRHDVTQSRIDLLPWPRQTHRVLAHLETRGSNASRICGFAGAKQNFFLQEQIDRCRHAGHVGRFRDKITTVIDQFLGVFGCDLVLRRTRESAVAFYAPRPLAGHIFGAAEFFRVLADASATDVFDAHYEGQLFLIDAVLVVNEPAGIRHRYRLSAALE